MPMQSGFAVNTIDQLEALILTSGGRFGIERNMITDHGTLRISIMLALRSIKRPIASRDAGIVA